VCSVIRGVRANDVPAFPPRHGGPTPVMTNKQRATDAEQEFNRHACDTRCQGTGNSREWAARPAIQEALQSVSIAIDRWGNDDRDAPPVLGPAPVRLCGQPAARCATAVARFERAAQQRPERPYFAEIVGAVTPADCRRRKPALPVVHRTLAPRHPEDSATADGVQQRPARDGTGDYHRKIPKIRHKRATEPRRLRRTYRGSRHCTRSLGRHPFVGHKLDRSHPHRARQRSRPRAKAAWQGTMRGASAISSGA
jgi:hypothetical protein